MGESPGKHGPPPVGAKASPVRLVVLLAFLALLAGALAYDYVVAGPGVVAADKTLKLEAEKNNATGFATTLTPEEKQKRLATSLFNPQKVQEILKRKPSRIDPHEQQNYTVEYYRWWGSVPLFNRRHYLAVVYHGKEPNLRYTTHYVNTPPPAESLPGYVRPEGDLKEPEGITMPGLPGGGGGDAEAGKGKGKGGKGLPPPGESPTDANPPAEGLPTGESTPPAETKDEGKEPAKDDAAKDGDRPAEGKPAAEKPAEEKPAAEKPAEEKPAADKPEAKGDEPAGEKKADE